MSKEIDEAWEALTPAIDYYFKVRLEERIAETAKELMLASVTWTATKKGALQVSTARIARQCALILHGQPVGEDKKEKEA